MLSQAANNKNYVSCHWATSGLEFRKDSIRSCCFAYLQNENEKDSIIIDNYHGEKIDWDNLLKLKKEHKELHKIGQFKPSCKGCIYLEKAIWSDNLFIDHLTFNHWSKCNCNCIYCYSASDKSYFNNYKHYNVLPILKEMHKKNILIPTDTSCISFGGGEPTILEEFEELLDFLISIGFKNIRINSSGIEYSPAIAKGLELNTVSLVISTDSGTKETYEKIKNVKCFEKVWQNIKRYSEKQTVSDALKIKYIIIPGINDSKKEIDKWFDLINKNNVKAIALSVEQHWYFENYPDFPDSIYEMINYIKTESEKQNLETEIYCEALSVLQLKDKKAE